MNSAPSTVRFGQKAKTARRVPRFRWLAPLVILPLSFFGLRTLRERPVAMPVPVSERIAPSTDFVFVIDDSGSAFGPGGTDPGGYRYAGARAVVNVLENESYGYDDQVGVVHFGSTTLSTRLRPVASDGPEIRKALLLPSSDLGGTGFVVAFDAAGKVLSSSTTKHRAVLFFTDGFTEDSSKDVLNAAKSLRGADLHVFLFNTVSAAEVEFQKSAQFWRRHAKSVTLLHDLSGNRAALAFAESIYAQLGVKTKT